MNIIIKLYFLEFMFILTALVACCIAIPYLYRQNTQLDATISRLHTKLNSIKGDHLENECREATELFESYLDMLTQISYDLEHELPQCKRNQMIVEIDNYINQVNEDIEQMRRTPNESRT